MATENELAMVLRDYLDKAPVFAENRAQAERNGFEVHDDISIAMKNPCGHPTGSLIRQYIGKGVEVRPLRSTFDLTLRGREWGVRCSSGYPGPDLD
ncbi:hypothetical protein Bsp3421_000090 (plasmid) [Burkholderia sp. FERM BP-3421]|uniref:hypothetical protein n=1 Tax=Burkholderia sp. FERM BP-3421 TaxID=1494466 RepID=UPI00236202B9|nr:hypothetical protein [Burkholderia sp. FERM BP-3421]WDD90267.1 hypothetical protein Bsp3421_000090 [Burkholderia sp. FERM BP-3421]